LLKLSSNESAKNWQRKNLESAKQNRKKWKKENKELCNAHISKRRAIKIGSTSETHDTKIEIELIKSKKRIQNCIGGSWAIDHINPLACGGKHHHANLQILPSIWNSRKKNNKNFEIQQYNNSID
jgi:5-methylcytosine-specific restriction endonuclease McrA